MEGTDAWGEALLDDVPDETSDEAYLEGLIELERERPGPPSGVGESRRRRSAGSIRLGHPEGADSDGPVQDEERTVVLQGESSLSK